MTMMNKGRALGMVAMAAALAACNVGSSGMGGFAGKVDKENLGLATRAQAALIENNHAAAVDLAERAVEGSPNDAGFRTLLGNAYFAAGRFASAEAAYRDSLALMPAQPKVILKKALVEIAQGKQGQALANLERAKGYVDAADLGLAVAMAGRPQVAIDILETAARSPQADARTRQNLALAHAMVGDWQTARVIAAQDIPAQALDARLQGWMQMANPEHPSQQVAALIGVVPAQVDPGQPVRLALNGSADQPRYANLAPQAAPAPAPVAVAAIEAPAAEPVVVAPSIAPQAAPTVLASNMDIPVRDIELVEVTAEAAAADEAEARPSLEVDPVAPVALVAEAQRAAATAAPKPSLSRETARLTESVRSIRHQAVSGEKASRSVVQLGSYLKRDHLQRGWAHATATFDPITAYQPMAARFEHDGKTYYRLAAHGFASDAAARDFCVDVKAAGGECFVRKMAGDAPTRFASR